MLQKSKSDEKAKKEPTQLKKSNSDGSKVELKKQKEPKKSFFESKKPDLKKPKLDTFAPSKVVFSAKNQQEPEYNMSVDVEVQKRTVAVSKKSKSEAVDIKMLFDNETVDPKEEGPVEVVEVEEVEEVQVETKRVRKKRKVTKSETYMHGKYLKTRDVDAWESYSDEEVVQAPKKHIKTNIATKSTGKGSKKPDPKQRTLNSFFKKAA
jgi:hypothetical protein